MACYQPQLSGWHCFHVVSERVCVCDIGQNVVPETPVAGTAKKALLSTLLGVYIYVCG